MCYSSTKAQHPFPLKEENTLDAATRQLVISLPKNGGQEVKAALRTAATKDHRTVSNMTFRILQDWLHQNGHLDKETPPV
tara:strand:- start:1270 stop:1509 length:240 start_codon:yes stop_codon:yes gene_type:complete